MFSLQTCLNQLIALADDAEKVITFHKTLLQWVMLVKVNISVGNKRK